MKPWPTHPTSPLNNPISKIILDEKDIHFVEGFKAYLLKAEAEHKQVQGDIEKLKAVIEAEKSAVLLMPEFLEQMEKVAQIIASAKTMVKLDFCIKKLFSNFFVD